MAHQRHQTFIVQLTSNPGVDYEVTAAELEQLESLGLVANAPADPVPGAFDTELELVVSDAGSATRATLDLLYGTGGTTPGVTDHGDLTGLSDDDHPQYALADGSRGEFATPTHNHDGAYATTGHTHAGYAPASHTHTVDDLDATGTPGATTFLRGDGQWAVPEGTGGGGGATDHGVLTGLGDDDHPQYALADGSRGAFAAPTHSHTASAISDPAVLTRLSRRFVNGVTALTLTAADEGTVIDSTHTEELLVTVPTVANGGPPVGARIWVGQESTGLVTVVPDTGVTLRARDDRVQTTGNHTRLQLHHIATNIWLITGDNLDFATVATSGDFEDLLNVPSVPDHLVWDGTGTPPNRPPTARPVQWFVPFDNQPTPDGTYAGGTYASAHTDVVWTHSDV